MLPISSNVKSEDLGAAKNWRDWGTPIDPIDPIDPIFRDEVP